MEASPIPLHTGNKRGARRHSSRDQALKVYLEGLRVMGATVSQSNEIKHIHTLLH